MQGGDYELAQCYYDAVQAIGARSRIRRRWGSKIGLCATKPLRLRRFRGHWAPNAMVLYDKDQFPPITATACSSPFPGRGSSPVPQGGYNVVFQALAGDRGSGNCEVFAEGFAGSEIPGRDEHRPSGLAVGPDGSYVSDDVRGRIYRIVTVTGPGRWRRWRGHFPCPAHAPAGGISIVEANPGRTYPDAGAVAGQRIFPFPQARPEPWWSGRTHLHGQVGGRRARVAMGERHSHDG